MADTKQLVIVNAGTSDPSTTRLLADRATTKALAEAKRRGIEIEARVIDLRPLAGDIMAALTTQLVSAELERATEILRDADAIIAATPVYKAAASGLFTAFFQALDNDLLIGTPVLLAATAGSPRHSLVVDDQLRGFFSLPAHGHSADVARGAPRKTGTAASSASVWIAPPTSSSHSSLAGSQGERPRRGLG